MTATSMWAHAEVGKMTSAQSCVDQGWVVRPGGPLLRRDKVPVTRETIPPLTRLDGTTATSSKEKADLLADIFATKMTVADPNRPPPQLAQECDQEITMGWR
ncbi:hypothetical protein Pmani_002163 [Petrolisthes manimaculis]|uniref:Uncharacterized protein n=1 Tax=Petrolisthes manimaculis TaxID=1843537 RepID=A0AAE1QIE9_9EUCA|nr:hypothetical protein Pmani_002163 [Petrolisthes manimaculis]